MFHFVNAKGSVICLKKRRKKKILRLTLCFSSARESVNVMDTRKHVDVLCVCLCVCLACVRAEDRLLFDTVDLSARYPFCSEFQVIPLSDPEGRLCTNPQIALISVCARMRVLQFLTQEIIKSVPYAY